MFSYFPHSVRLVFIACVSVCFSYWLSLLSWATSMTHCCSELLTYLGLNYLRQGQHEDIFLQNCSERYCVDIATKFKKFHNQRFWQILAKFSILKSLQEVYFTLLYLFHDRSRSYRYQFVDLTSGVKGEVFFHDRSVEKIFWCIWIIKLDFIKEIGPK